MSLPKLIHFTEGGPYHGYTDQLHSQAWAQEFADLLGGKNPCSSGICEAGPKFLKLEVKYEQKTDI